MAYGEDGIAIAQKPANSPPRVRQESIRLDVIALGDADFHIRETATQKIIVFGPMAIEVLLPALASDDAEIAWRAKFCIEAIVQHDPSGLGVLTNLSGSHNSQARELAGAIIQREQIRLRKENSDDRDLYRQVIMSEKARSIERNLGFE